MAKEEKKIFNLFDVDIGAERNLKAMVYNSFIDAYLTQKIMELMALVDKDDQSIIVDIIGAYIYRNRRKKFGNRYIDHELRWILNRAEVLKTNRTGCKAVLV